MNGRHPDNKLCRLALLDSKTNPCIYFVIMENHLTNTIDGFECLRKNQDGLISSMKLEFIIVFIYANLLLDFQIE